MKRQSTEAEMNKLMQSPTEIGLPLLLFAIFMGGLLVFSLYAGWVQYFMWLGWI